MEPGLESRTSSQKFLPLTSPPVYLLRTVCHKGNYRGERPEPFPTLPKLPEKKLGQRKEGDRGQTQRQRPREEKAGQAEQKRTNSWNSGLTAHTRATRGTLMRSYESNAREVSVKKK